MSDTPLDLNDPRFDFFNRNLAADPELKKIDDWDDGFAEALLLLKEVSRLRAEQDKIEKVMVGWHK